MDFLWALVKAIDNIYENMNAMSWLGAFISVDLGGEIFCHLTI